MNRARISLALTLLLAACNPPAAEDPLAALETELASADTPDPALMGALHGPMMIDPALRGPSNADAVRPPQHPYTAAIPPSDIASRPNLTEAVSREKLLPAPQPTGSDCPQCEAARNALALGALAAQVAPATCAAAIVYSNRWAARLPETLPLIPDARVIEAAGTDARQCGLRAVRYWTDLPPEMARNWLFTRASNAGYASERAADAKGDMLTGKGRAGTYTAFLAPRPGGGTTIDFVTAGK